MNHQFNIHVAKDYGIEEAIILENIIFWVTKNYANNKNYHDGYYWTYNSSKAFSEQFEYIHPEKIRRTLINLEKIGFIKSGNYNKSKYDRTKWYTVTPIIKQYYDLSNPFLKMWNGDLKNVEPIPDNKQSDSKHIICTDKSIHIGGTPIKKSENNLPVNIQKENKKFKKPTIEEIKEYCLQRNNKINSEYFYDYYESNGWCIGKSKMKDWKAAVRNWESREEKWEKQNNKKHPDTLTQYHKEQGTTVTKAKDNSDLIKDEVF